MPEGFDWTGLLPLPVRAFANGLLAVAVAIAVIAGLYHSLRSFSARGRDEDDEMKPIDKIAEQFGHALLALAKSNELLEKLVDIAERRRQKEEIDSAYWKGRAAQEDQIRQSRQSLVARRHREESGGEG